MVNNTDFNDLRHKICFRLTLTHLTHNYRVAGRKRILIFSWLNQFLIWANHFKKGYPLSKREMLDSVAGHSLKNKI